VGLLFAQVLFGTAALVSLRVRRHRRSSDGAVRCARLLQECRSLRNRDEHYLSARHQEHFKANEVKFGTWHMAMLATKTGTESVMQRELSAKSKLRTNKKLLNLLRKM
jgi:hypothetical protein